MKAARWILLAALLCVPLVAQAQDDVGLVLTKRSPDLLHCTETMEAQLSFPDVRLYDPATHLPTPARSVS
jgi:hypothetical protein